MTSPCAACARHLAPSAKRLAPLPHCADKIAGSAPLLPCHWVVPATLADYVAAAQPPAPRVKGKRPVLVVPRRFPALTWSQLRRIGQSYYGGAKAWHPNESVAEYFASYRTPSAAFPYSYSDAAMTYKFQKWLLLNRPDIALTLYGEDAP